MISEDQIQFIKKYINVEYFNVLKVVNYLKLHNLVGADIFELARKTQNQRKIRVIGDGDEFQPLDVDIFVRRVPFYFYVPDVNRNQYGDLVSLLYGERKDGKSVDSEEIYMALEKLFYQYKIEIPEIMEYLISLTGTCRRLDIFFKWVHYLDLCVELNIKNKYPQNFLYEYNRILVLAKELPIIYMPGVIGYNENFLRKDREIIISGEFPCDDNNNPMLEWIGIWIENAEYVNVNNCYSVSECFELEKELHIGLAPVTKIYMYDNSVATWYSIYQGPKKIKLNKEVFKNYRHQSDITQQKIADSLDVNIRTYQTWEKGDRFPDGYNLIKLMNYLNIENVQKFIKDDSIYDPELSEFRKRKKYK